MHGNVNMSFPKNSSEIFSATVVTGRRSVCSLMLMTGLALVLLLLSGGCAGTGKMDLPTIDMGEVSKTIVRDESRSAVLEAETPEPEAKREAVIDLSRPAGGKTNPASRLQLQPGEDKTTGQGDQAEGILLNFDNADIFEVIQVIAETLDLNYIIDPQVKGVVNIHSGKKIPQDQLFTIFKKILHINGLDIRSEGDYNYIYVAKKPAPQIIGGADQISHREDSARIILQIVPLYFMPAAEALKLIEPALSAQGAAYTLEDQNTLLVSDYESKIIDVLKLLAKIDVSPLANLQLKLVRVDNAPLYDLRDELVEIFTALKINRNQFEGISVVPLERINSLLLISSNDYHIENGLKWINELDVVPSQDRDNIYIYNVRNSVASELAELINQLITEEKPESKTSTRQKAATSTPPTTATTPKATPVSRSQSTTATSSPPLSSLRFLGVPVVFADDDRNIILIRALPGDYSRIVKLLERLDNLPRQVLVEAIVAEISLSNELELGLEWYISSNKFGFGTEFTAVGMADGGPPSGFSYKINYGDVDAFLQTLATKNDFSILSSPQILVLNNEKATVNVGTQVPIVTTVTENTTTTSQVDKTVQYVDTGVILEVTPQINYNGIILLEIKQTVSDAQENTTSDISSPEISKRELQTKLAIKNGQSILMGGMIDKNTSTIKSGVPFLMDIPVLGNLFKYQKDATDKRELIVLITPHVIESEDVLDQYIREFEEKMNRLRADIHEPLPYSPRKKW